MAVSTDKRKDLMIEQLDKVWKKCLLLIQCPPPIQQHFLGNKGMEGVEVFSKEMCNFALSSLFI